VTNAAICLFSIEVERWKVKGEIIGEEKGISATHLKTSLCIFRMLLGFSLPFIP
jgi:hypothetical protein